LAAIEQLETEKMTIEAEAAYAAQESDGEDETNGDVIMEA
jgi:hypothetical protein